MGWCVADNNRWEPIHRIQPSQSTSGHHRVNNIGVVSDSSMPSGVIGNSSLSRAPTLSYTGERSHPSLPPSLWMSPASTSVTASSAHGALNNFPSTFIPGSSNSSHRSPNGQSPVSPTSPITDSRSTLFTDIFSDELFNGPNRISLSPQAASPFTSPRVSGSPDLQAADIGPGPEQLAKDDPLATQVWKMYARTKATLPHAQRMENITWRMMALALKKRKEDEEAKTTAVGKEKQETSATAADVPNETSRSQKQLEADPDPSTVLGERGRRIDKGKTKVRVVGFDGTNQDGFEEKESVGFHVFDQSTTITLTLYFSL